MRDGEGKLVFDRHGQIKVNIGDSEIRVHEHYPEPFALYPGESLGKMDSLPVVPRDCAIKLEAIRDFVDEGDVKRVAGDEWLEEGPKLYIPKIEVKLVQHIKPTVITSNTALRVKAIRSCKDYKGTPRQAGEEWLIRDIGFYIPHIDEEVAKLEEGKIINERTALFIQANQTFTDMYGIERKAGE